MWALDNKTPFPAHAGFLRDHTGQSWWQIWIKGTFALSEGGPCRFLPDQAPLNLGPVYVDDDPAGLMLADGDLAHHKPQVDLTFAATATPEAETHRDISFVIGDWRKTVRITPPQIYGGWRGSPRCDPETPVAPIALDWRYAAGGSEHPSNPLGQDNSRPAQLIYTDEVPHPRKPSERAAGLGPMPPHWPLRQHLGGTYDTAWERGRAPLLPKDFDPHFWQVAPPDQRLDRDALGAPVLEVAGLTARNARQSYALPTLDLDLQTKIDADWHPAPAALQGIHVDLNDLTATVTYAARWQVPHTAADVTFARSTVMLGRRNTFRVSVSDLEVFRQNAEGAFA